MPAATSGNQNYLWDCSVVEVIWFLDVGFAKNCCLADMLSGQDLPRTVFGLMQTIQNEHGLPKAQVYSCFLFEHCVLSTPRIKNLGCRLHAGPALSRMLV